MNKIIESKEYIGIANLFSRIALGRDIIDEDYNFGMPTVICDASIGSITFILSAKK